MWIPIRSEGRPVSGRKDYYRSKDYLLCFLLRRRVMDLEGGFRVGSDLERLQTTEILVTDQVPEGVSSSVPLPGRGLRELTEMGDRLFLRDERGDLHDHRNCFGFRGARPAEGMLYRDEHGTDWLLEVDGPFTQVIISPDASLEPGLEDALSEVPVWGDFVLNDDVPPQVGHVVWFDRADYGLAKGERTANLDAEIADLRSRAAARRAEGPIFRAQVSDEPVSEDKIPGF